jgi:hypothetical protein
MDLDGVIYYGVIILEGKTKGRERGGGRIS